MKTFKQMLALVLAVVILALSLPVARVDATTDPDMNYGRKMLSQMPNGTALVKIYDSLVEGIATLEDAVYTPDNITITYNEMETIYDMVYSDHPEYFWISRGTPGYWGSYENVVAITPLYAIDFEGFGKFDNLETAKIQYNNKVNELTSGLNGKSNYEKAKILHDRLCETVTYTNNCNNHQNAYGALVEGTAVCNGYARAYHHLLKVAGIPAWYVSGSSRGIEHAWNLVKIDGSWYYSDVTWDDTDDRFEYFDNNYEYMNITTAQLLKDHTIDSYYASLVPNATATAANYYVKENLIFSSFNKNQLLTAFLNSEKHAVFAKFTNGYTHSQFSYSFYDVEKDIAASLGSTGDYELHELVFSYTVDHNLDNANWIVYLDYDIASVCQHSYKNACDNTCNKCGKVRVVGDHVYTNSCDTTCNECGLTRTITHKYSNKCDTTCNVCGSTRTVPDHIYTSVCDKNCNECGATRTVPDHIYDDACDATCNICNSIRKAPHFYDDDQDDYCNKCDAKRISFWIETVDATGVYAITPNKTIDGFNKESITLSDKNGNAVRYNDNKNGWPLVKEQQYIITLNVDFADINDLSWNLTKKVDTIFTDTVSAEQGGWYNDAVTYSVGAGLITGYGGTDKFGTADNIQRQDFVVILARLAGVDLENYQSNRASFADVPRDAYYENAILWAADCGITTGYSDASGKFGVGDNITREQLVTFLYRYAKYQNGGTSPEVSREAAVNAAAYPDFAGVTDYAKEPIIWALDKGVMSGQGGTHIAPGGNALRCEAAKIFFNIFDNNIFN